MAGGGRRRLSAGHGIDQVVDADDFQIDVAAGGMDQVIAADGGKIAVARVDDHIQLGIREFQSGGEGNCTAVCGVERIELDVSGHAAGAADARNERERSRSIFDSIRARAKAIDRSADAAPWAPDVRHAVAAEKRLDWVDDVQQIAHRLASTITFRICSGLCTPPPGVLRRGKFVARPAAARSTSSTICPRLSSGTTKAFTFAASPEILFFGERPGGDEAQLADFESACAGHFDGALGDAGGDAVGDDDDIGIVEMFFFEEAMRSTGD